MDFAIPEKVVKDLEQFKAFLQTHMEPHLAQWYREEAVPREFIQHMGQNGWLGFSQENGDVVEQSGLREAILFENLAPKSLQGLLWRFWSRFLWAPRPFFSLARKN
ncbi:MAG: hypothetical protein GTN81_03355 [Proteobacteria bacterium]|nr:hypothetical protein [Pseudomonadota bacterium]